MRFLRTRQVMQVTSLSRMTIYRLEITGRFPKRRQLSGNSVAWLESDIEAWGKARPIAPLRSDRMPPCRRVFRPGSSSNS